MPVPSPLDVRCMAYRAIIHSMQRQGISILTKGMLRDNPVLLMAFKSPARYMDALMEMEAVHLLRKNGRGWLIISDQPKLLCCICGEALTGDCVQDGSFLLAHAACADAQAEEHATPIHDRTH